jgi:hypothetical protein
MQVKSLRYLPTAPHIHYQFEFARVEEKCFFWQTNWWICRSIKGFNKKLKHKVEQAGGIWSKGLGKWWALWQMLTDSKRMYLLLKNWPGKRELDLYIRSISEETVRVEGKGAKNGSGFSTVWSDSTPFAQNRSRKNVTLGANSGQFSLAKWNHN